MAKKTINGKQYDTEKATCIGNWSNELETTNPNSMLESLYKKRTGEFFIYGQGGEATKYAEASGSSWVGSSKIMPLSYDDAKNWSKERLDASEYDVIFGEKTYTYDTYETLYLNVSSEMYDKLDRIVSKRGNGATKTSIIEELIASIDEQKE